MKNRAYDSGIFHKSATGKLVLNIQINHHGEENISTVGKAIDVSTKEFVRGTEYSRIIKRWENQYHRLKL